MNEKQVFFVDDMAQMMGCSVGAFRQMIRRGLVLQPLRIGVKLAWRPQDVEQWLQNLAVEQGVAVSAINEPHQQRPEKRRRGRPRKTESEL